MVKVLLHVQEVIDSGPSRTLSASDLRYKNRLLPQLKVLELWKRHYKSMSYVVTDVDTINNSHATALNFNYRFKSKD